MNPAVLLNLISSLYEEALMQREANATLEAENQELKEKLTAFKKETTDV